MENDVRWRKLQCADFLTSESEEEQVRGAKMQPLTVVDRSGQRLCPLPIFFLRVQQARAAAAAFP